MNVYKLIIYKNVRYHSQKENRIPTIAGAFTVLGQFDYILLKRNPNENKLSEILANKESKEHYIDQTFLLFDNDDNDFIIDNKENYLFQFITISYYNNTYFTHQNFDSGCENDIIWHTYNTINNAAFITICYSNSYNKAIKKIYDLSQYYCDLSDFNYSFLSLNEKLLSDSTFEKESYIEEVSAEINFNVKNYKSFIATFQILLQYLENKSIEFMTFPLLGNKDIQLFIKKISITELFKFYNKFLKADSKCRIPATYSYSTNIVKLLENTKSIEDFFSVNNSKFLSKNTINLDIMFSNLKKELEKLSNVDTKRLTEFINNLSLNSYLKPFGLAVYPSLKNVIKKHKDKIIGDEALDEYCRSIYEISTFLSSTSLHTYHDPVVLPEQNFIPEKLLNFYTVYMYSLQDSINKYEDNNYNFDFLVKPVETQIINISSLQQTSNPKNRILIIEIPIKQIYSIDMIIHLLTHELAHFVGNKMRHRKKRYEAIKLFFIDIIVYSIMNDYLEIGDTEIQSINKFVSQLIGKLAKKVQLSIEDNLKYHLYSVRLLITEIIQYISDNYIEIGKYLQLSTGLDSSKYNLEKGIVRLFNVIEVNSLIELYNDYESLLRECYSDLFSIKLLNISFEKYVSYFNMSLDLTNQAPIDDLTCFRIAIVSSICFDISENLSDNLNYVHPDSAYKISELKNTIASGNYLGIENTLNCLIGKDTISSLVDYLKSCHDEISKIINHNVEENPLNNYSKYYNTFDKQSIVEIVEEIHNIIYEYYNDN